MKQVIHLTSEAIIETPPEARPVDVAEALLQEFTAWLAGRPGLRARRIEAVCSGTVRGYAQTDAKGDLTPRASQLEVAE